jgi:hypothetical protein
MAYHMLVSHSGEQKMTFVAHFLARLRDEHPEVQVFVDEWSLKPGDAPASAIEEACTTAKIGDASRRCAHLATHRQALA